MKTIKGTLIALVFLVVIVSIMLAACGNGGDRSSNGNGKANGNGKDKIIICHKTDDAANPYVEISIPGNAAKGHAKHDGDLIPAPDGGCPK